MFSSIAYAICVFMAVWNGLVIGLNLFNDSLESIGVLNILMLALGITGIVLHV